MVTSSLDREEAARGREEPASGKQGPTKRTEPSAATYGAHIQGSIVAAHAQGPGTQAVGIVHQYGLSYADVREIVDDRVALAVERLREAVGQAQGRSVEDILRVSFAVVRSLVAAKLGAEPDAGAVADFLREAVDDPAFPARAARLFQEGAKTPSPARREMLARALFGIPAATPERDRVDAAVEKLFPADVKLLADLIRFSLPFLLLAEGPEHGAKPYIVREEDRQVMMVKQIVPEPQLICDPYALHNLHSAGCIKIDRIASRQTKTYHSTMSALVILPLGHAVMRALAGAGQLSPETAGAT